MKNKEFLAPNHEIIRLDAADIITSSEGITNPTDPVNPDPGTGTGGNSGGGLFGK